MRASPGGVLAAAAGAQAAVSLTGFGLPSIGPELAEEFDLGLEAGWVAAIGGMVFALALHAGPAEVIPAAILFAFGGLGWNALVYVRAGEMAPPLLAAQSVAVAATIVFVVSAAVTPPMGALADAAGWDVFWLVTAGVAACGALTAGTLRTTPPLVASERGGG